jgi:hypothetical protein
VTIDLLLRICALGITLLKAGLKGEDCYWRYKNVYITSEFVTRICLICN